MYLADYHVHSRISPDASASMQEMAEAAIRLGFQEICFTDHVEPIRFGTTEPRGAYDWDPMIAEFRAARTAVGDRITLRLGAELGDAVWGIRRMESMLAEAPPLDFLIGSIHTLSEKMEGRDLYFLTPRDEQEARDCLADYLGQVRKLAEWGRFQVLGHLTLPLRYLNENRGMHVSFDGFEEEIAEIFRLIIPKGIGIELNTNRGNTPLPDEKWLRLYRSLGGEIVTLGDGMPTRRGLWAVPSGRGRRCCGPADSAVLPPSGRGNRCGMNCDLLFRGKLAIINPFQPHSSPNGMT